jgi:hypothetical protein
MTTLDGVPAPGLSRTGSSSTLWANPASYLRIQAITTHQSGETEETTFTWLPSNLVTGPRGEPGTRPRAASWQSSCARVDRAAGVARLPVSAVQTAWDAQRCRQPGNGIETFIAVGHGCWASRRLALPKAGRTDRSGQSSSFLKTSSAVAAGVCERRTPEPWTLDAARLHPARAVIRLMRHGGGGHHPDPPDEHDHLPFTTAALRTVSQVTLTAIQRLEALTPGDPWQPFADVPHTLYHGSIPISWIRRPGRDGPEDV